MPGVVSSHRPTTKVANKAFKSRKATKGGIRDLAKGKVPTEKGLRKTPHQQVMSKFDRRNQARQRQLNKQREHQKENSIFSGRDAAPRNVAVIPLCEDCDAVAAVRSLNQSLDIEAEIGQGLSRVPVDRFKQKLAYFPAKRDLAACMDAAGAADFVVLVLSADVEVDDLGELILRSIEGQGLSTLITTVQGLNKIEPVKQRLSVVDSLKSYIKYYHPEQDKIYSLDNRQECANLMRSICSTTPKGVRWRDERSWILVEDVQFPPTDAVDGLTVLTGFVRGKGLKADRLVQVGDWGTFQIEKITAAPLSTRKGNSEGSMVVDEASAPEEPLDVPSEDRDDLAEFAPEEMMMIDDDDGGDDALTSVSAPTKKGVLLDDHHYFSDDDEGQAPRAKRLPKGTSAYQAAWYLDDGVSDSGSDMEDFDMADAAHPERSHGPEDGIEEGMAMDTQTEAGASEYPQSEMFVEPNEDEDARQLEAYRASKRDEAEDDKEFPDEIELHPNVLARERLARYRGLKSLRTSTWEEEEDRAHEPEEWRRLLQVPDYQGSRSRCTREALVGGVAPGTRVSVHLKGVPASVSQLHDATKPVAMFSLLRHENKHTAVNFLINLSSEHPTSIKAKEELIMQCGPRRLVIRPLFSEGGNTQNDVHKYSRFLHPGQSAVATFIGPVIWGSVPALFYKRRVPSTDARDGGDEAPLPLKLIATGTALPPSTSRVVAKRVILTGHPYHIHKKIVTIRYMFFNREDVEWFKALPLWTRRGRSGFVKESLGTHGYFKATFDGKINPQDSVGVSLYKRVWPRKSEPFRGSLLPGDEERTAGVEQAMEVIA